MSGGPLPHSTEQADVSNPAPRTHCLCRAVDGRRVWPDAEMEQPILQAPVFQQAPPPPHHAHHHHHHHNEERRLVEEEKRIVREALQIAR